MNIQTSKIKLAKMILELEDSSLLEKILQLVKTEGKLTLKQKNFINEAIAELDNGLGIPHDIVMEETKKRYSKYFEE